MYQQPKAAAFARSYLHMGVFEGANSERFKGLLHRGCLQDPSINKTKSLAYVIFLSQRASVSASRHQASKNLHHTCGAQVSNRSTSMAKFKS
jgi:hypothetical protein